MGITVLSDKAAEESTYIVTVAFTDEDGTAVTPNSITWTLTDSDGNTINSRSGVSIAVPAASNDIVLQGDDLAIQRPSMLRRRMTISAPYDSGAGSSLPFRGEIEFEITPLLNV